jgi:uncharacterized cofD-like protein
VKAACLGGGGGLVQVLRGLLLHDIEPVALVGIADNGRSTGLARRMFDIPAPGDIRSVLSSMSTDETMRGLFELRFDTPVVPELTGMAFGNLFIGALAKQTGSFQRAVAYSAKLLKPRVSVLPLSAANVDLAAELEDGSIVTGEVEVRRPGKAPIKRVFLNGPAPALPEAVEAIETADLVTLGPGSLFTSILACLAVDGIAGALARSKALRVYVANTTTQPGQSDELGLEAQIRHIHAAVDGALDAVLINNAAPDPGVMQSHAVAGRQLLALTAETIEQLQALGVEAIAGDLIEREEGARVLWQKEDTIRHDPDRLGRALSELARKKGIL